ncbi:MAG: hypothetical protein R6T83_12410 [Salinibacter sp.]
MSRRIVGTAALGIGLLLLGVGHPTPSHGPLEPADKARVARATGAPDTLTATVGAGDALILSLPDATRGTTVASYRMLRGPALSGVAGRSLTWITRDVAPGTYTLLLQARRPGADPDTMVVRVEVQPS